MKLRPSKFAAPLGALLFTASALLSVAHGAVNWSVAVNIPAPEAQAAPSIEQMQAQQQARIQWGVQVGLITPHEHARLQQTQQYIETQRHWAYADGWLTYDEHVHLITLLNSASEEIERKLANWQRVQQTYYPMPPALTYWSAPRHEYYGHQGYQGHHHGHAHQGHNQSHQHQSKPARMVVPLPSSPPLPPLPHLLPSPNQVIKQLQRHIDNVRY